MSIRRLKSEDIHQGDWHGPNNTHCLMGHLGGVQGVRVRIRMHEALRAELDRRGLFFHFKTVNDFVYTKREVAELWNKAADDVEGEPIGVMLIEVLEGVRA